MLRIGLTCLAGLVFGVILEPLGQSDRYLPVHGRNDVHYLWRTLSVESLGCAGVFRDDLFRLCCLEVILRHSGVLREAAMMEVLSNLMCLDSRTRLSTNLMWVVIGSFLAPWSVCCRQSARRPVSPF